MKEAKISAMQITIIPATSPVFALYFSSDPNARDVMPVVAWLYELSPSGSHYLRGFVIDCSGGLALAEKTENFDRYSYDSE